MNMSRKTFYADVRVQYVIFAVLAVLFVLNVYAFGGNIANQLYTCKGNSGHIGNNELGFGYYVEVQAPHPLAGYRFPCQAVNMFPNGVARSTGTSFQPAGYSYNAPTYMPLALASSCTSRWGSQAFTDLYNLDAFYFYEVSQYFIDDNTFEKLLDVPMDSVVEKQSVQMTYACRLKCSGTTTPVRQPNSTEATSNFVTPTYVTKPLTLNTLAKFFIATCALATASGFMYVVTSVWSAVEGRPQPFLFAIALILDVATVIMSITHNSLPSDMTPESCSSIGAPFLDQQIFTSVSLISTSFVTLRIAFWITSFWDYEDKQAEKKRVVEKQRAMAKASSWKFASP
jgi:hypothetical protein